MSIAGATASSEPTALPAPAIKAIHVLRSGTGEQHREHRLGSAMPRLWWVLTSQSWVKLPVHYFLIEHRDGAVLFDTGLDPAIVADPGYISSAIGRFLLRRIFRLHITEEDRLDKVLAAHGYSAADIRTAVISHLHFDHVGGIAHIPQAELLVGAKEWAQLAEPHPEREWILREHIDIPHAQWRPIKFEPTADPLFGDFEGVWDVAGDGAMVLLPTPGHTPGSLSMLVRRAGWQPILLVADLAYEAGLLAQGVFPGTGDKKVLKETYEKVGRLQDKLPGLTIVTAHDFTATDSIARATQGQGQAHS